MEVLRPPKTKRQLNGIKRKYFLITGKSLFVFLKKINIHVKLQILEEPKIIRVYDISVPGKNQRITQD